MKILSLNTNVYNKRGSLFTPTNKALQNPLYTSFSVNSNLPLSSDTISFKKTYSDIYIDDMRELPDLPCACCGNTMLQNSVVNNFLNEKIYYPASVSLRRLKSEHIFNESRAANGMKEAYVYLKEYADNNPELTMNDILSKRAVKDKRKNMPTPVKESFDTFKELSKLIAHNSKYMVDEINKLNPNFHKTEKRVFKELQKLAQEYPNETFYDILNKPKVKDRYLENLKAKQMYSLKRVSDLADGAPPELKAKIKNQIKTAKKIFTEEGSEFYHKRTRVIELFNKVFEEEKEKTPLGNLILETINQLPDSKTDVNAFMVKGSQQNSNAIVEILLSRVRSTFEHVKPHKRENDNGDSKITNYIGLCGKCNIERQRTSYDIFTIIHPEMIENEQIQLNKIIEYINSGILIKHDDYPEAIKKALDTESKGAIKVDTKSYNPKEAKKNRKKRQEIYVKQKRAEEKQPKIFKFGKGTFIKKTTQ